MLLDDQSVMELIFIFLSKLALPSSLGQVCVYGLYMDPLPPCTSATLLDQLLVYTTLHRLFRLVKTRHTNLKNPYLMWMWTPKNFKNNIGGFILLFLFSLDSFFFFPKMLYLLEFRPSLKNHGKNKNHPFDRFHPLIMISFKMGMKPPLSFPSVPPGQKTQKKTNLEKGWFRPFM